MKDLTEITHKSRDQLAKGLAKVKEVCTNYFQSYETSLEENKIRTHVLENKYNDWSKLLIEPNTLN